MRGTASTKTLMTNAQRLVSIGTPFSRVIRLRCAERYWSLADRVACPMLPADRMNRTRSGVPISGASSNRLARGVQSSDVDDCGALTSRPSAISTDASVRCSEPRARRNSARRCRLTCGFVSAMNAQHTDVVAFATRAASRAVESSIVRIGQLASRCRTTIWKVAHHPGRFSNLAHPLRSVIS